MSITKTKIGEKDSKEIYLYKLDNGKGLTAEIINLGADILRLCYSGVDVVLGYNKLEDYFENNGYFGTIAGRNANRIGGAELVIGTETYKLTANQLGNQLHGGFEGFHRKVWDSEMIDDSEPSLKLTLVSPDGEEGFPGEVTVTVTYTLTKDDTLHMHYEGISDKDTALNLTNHSYFNLNGHNSGTILNHKLRMNCSFYTPNGEGCLPTGEVLSVKGTPFDFLEEKTIGENMSMPSEQLAPYHGFDHNFVVDGFGYRFVAELKGDTTGISMQIYSDAPGMQICAGNYIDTDLIYKDGTSYPQYGGVCLETQAFPNWNSFSHFAGGWLKKGEKYDTVTDFKFYK